MTAGAFALLSGALQGRHQNRHQRSNHSDYYEQLNERKSFLPHHSFTLTKGLFLMMQRQSAQEHNPVPFQFEPFIGFVYRLEGSLAPNRFRGPMPNYLVAKAPTLTRICCSIAWLRRVLEISDAALTYLETAYQRAQPDSQAQEHHFVKPKAAYSPGSSRKSSKYNVPLASMPSIPIASVLTACRSTPSDPRSILHFLHVMSATSPG